MTSTSDIVCTPSHAAAYASRSHAGEIRCDLCPHRCILQEGEAGFCRVRECEHGELITRTYGRVVTPPAKDAVEKKPFYHVTPGESVTTVGGVGCTMICPYCYNWPLVYCSPQTASLTGEELRDAAIAQGSRAVVFAYNEPVLAVEFICDVSPILHEAGLLVAAVTNGFVDGVARDEFLSAVDAVLIDIKDTRHEFYSNTLRGDLEITWSTLEHAYGKVHLEAKWVVLPQRETHVEQIAERLAGVDRAIPFHVSRYYPHYQWTEHATPVSLLRQCWEKAKDRLEYVYSPELGEEFAVSTRCPECSELLITREPSGVRVLGLTDNDRCRECGKTIPLLSGS